MAAILGTRIYPDRLPQSPTVPAAVYYGIGGVDEPQLSGLMGQAQERIQIDAYAATRLAANLLAIAIRDALTSSWGRGTWGTVGVSGCNPEGGERYDTQDKGDGSDEPWYITSRDYLIYFVG